MKRSKLKNLFNKNKTEETWCKYKIQRNYYVNILYKTKKHYYKNLDIKYHKKFWKSAKPHFDKDDSNSEKMMLLLKIIQSKQIRKKLQQ